MSSATEPLRLLAQDADDLTVVSAALQDAIARVRDVQWEAGARRLTLELNRYRWERGARGRGQRVRTGLQICDVLSVRARGLNQDAPDAVSVLLHVAFDPADEPPGGVLRLVFAGDGEIAVHVECLDLTLADVSPAWPAHARPQHPDVEA